MKKNKKNKYIPPTRSLPFSLLSHSLLFILYEFRSIFFFSGAKEEKKEEGEEEAEKPKKEKAKKRKKKSAVGLARRVGHRIWAKIWIKSAHLHFAFDSLSLSLCSLLSKRGTNISVSYGNDDNAVLLLFDRHHHRRHHAQ